MVFTRSCYKAKTIMPNKAPDENEIAISIRHSKERLVRRENHPPTPSF